MKMPKYPYHMALMFSGFITARHATIEEAAAYFKVPKSTLWDALERLTPSDRAASLKIAKENIHHRKKRG